VARVKENSKFNLSLNFNDLAQSFWLKKRALTAMIRSFPNSQDSARMIRDAIKQALVEAMKAKDTQTVSTLRMAQAAIKNRDIELRTSEAPANDDVLVIDVLTKMVKQRRESIDMYEKGGRSELAEVERAEVAVLERFLPSTMSEEEAQKVIGELVAELGASSPKDMGKVMGALKERYAGQIDMGKAGPIVKAALAG